MAKKRRRPSESPTAADRPSHRCAGSGSQDGPRRVGTPRTPRRGPGNRASAPARAERKEMARHERERARKAIARRSAIRRALTIAGVVTVLSVGLPGLLQREIEGRRIGPGTRRRRRGRMRRHRDAGRRGAGRHPPRIGRVRRYTEHPATSGPHDPSPLPTRVPPSRSGRRTRRPQPRARVRDPLLPGGWTRGAQRGRLGPTGADRRRQDKVLAAPYPDLEERAPRSRSPLGTSCGVPCGHVAGGRRHHGERLHRGLPRNLERPEANAG